MGSAEDGGGTGLLTDGEPAYSRRTPSPGATNRMARVLAGRVRPYVDLTISNPTAVGFPFPSAGVLAALADPRSRVYAPEAKGLRSAREAVAVRYAKSGTPVDPESIVLTASSSESYSWLFKLLCDPGDVVLAPAPSYPLFDALADLEGVALHRYPLVSQDAYRVHAAAIEREVDQQESEGRTVKAVVLVNPNNPTGSSIGRAELDALLALASERRFAVISDEVFADYRFLDAADDVLTVAAHGRDVPATVFSLGGLSKSAVLPQLKLGWILVNGPPGSRAETLSRLEWIADAYLSVGVPVQNALCECLSWGDLASEAVRARILANARTLERTFPAGHAVTTVPFVAGWSGILRLPAVEPEEDLVLDLLETHDVLVHPGFFFDFPAEAFLVVSLLPRPEDFEEGVARLVRRLPK